MVSLLGWQACCDCGYDEHDADVTYSWGLQDEYSPHLGTDEVLCNLHYPEALVKPPAAVLPLTRLREEFDARAGPDSKVGATDLAKIWQACASRENMLGPEESLTISVAAEHYMRQMNLARDFRVNYFVLVAFMLGALTSPTHPGVLKIQEVIRKVTQEDPEEVISKIVSEFLAMDSSSTGVVKLSDFLAYHGESADNMLAFESADFGCDKGIDLWDYIVHGLRKWTFSVELVIYDLSKGVAKVLGSTPACKGAPLKFEALYHTSIVVHGAEYWYGHSIRRSDQPPVSGAFGPPLDKFADVLQPSEYIPGLRVVRLGRTFARKEEVAHLVSTMAGARFAKGKYNAFSNNCNCFTNELSLLLTGRGIPRAVRMQSELFMNSPTLRMVLPAIKVILGEQGNQMDIEVPDKPEVNVVRKSVADEILGLKGKVCGFWNKDTGTSRYGIVACAWESSFDIRWFNPRTCAFSVQMGVPSGSVHSWFDANANRAQCRPVASLGDVDATELEMFEV